MKQEKKNRILCYIREYKQQNTNRSPSIGEIAQYCSISKSTVHNYLLEMTDEGLLKYDGVRNITFPEETVVMKRVAVLGKIACGTPCQATENPDGYVDVPSEMLGTGDYFCLRASGDSMINAGISDGDYVLIRRQNTADAGNIAVVLTNDNEEATLKRYYPDFANNRIRLHPENDSMEDFYVSECLIQGVATKVIKNI